MRHINCWTLVVVALVSLAARAEEPAKEDLQKMQGTWEVSRIVLGGKEAKKLDDNSFVIKDDVITFESPREKNSARLTLDPGSKPRQFDAVILDGTEKGKTRKAIYELDGDTLKICWATSSERPTKFASENGESFLYMELKRKK